MAVEVDDVVVEVLARAGGIAPKVRVDGEVISVAMNASFNAGAGVVVSRLPHSPGSLLFIDTPTFDARLTYDLPWQRPDDGALNLSLLTNRAGLMSGMLGSDDGDPDNDLTLSDGTTITLEEARAHDTDLYRFTDFVAPHRPRRFAVHVRVRRVRRPERTSSGIGRDGAVPGAGDRPAQRTELDLFRLGEHRLVRGRRPRLELAIGGQPETLGEFVCNYSVVGNVSSLLGDDSQVPVPGAVARSTRRSAPCM